MLVILGPFLINYIGMDMSLKMLMKIGDQQVTYKPFILIINFILFYYYFYSSLNLFVSPLTLSGCESESHRRGVPIPACEQILNTYMAPANLGPDFDPDNSFTDPCTGIFL